MFRLAVSKKERNVSDIFMPARKSQPNLDPKGSAGRSNCSKVEGMCDSIVEQLEDRKALRARCNFLSSPFRTTSFIAQQIKNSWHSNLTCFAANCFFLALAGNCCPFNRREIFSHWTFSRQGIVGLLLAAQGLNGQR